MRGRPKKVAAKDPQTHRETPTAKDGQSAADEAVRDQGPETADEAQQEADVAQDDPSRAETGSDTADTVADAGTEAATEVQEAVQAVEETEAPELGGEAGEAQTTQPDSQTAPPQEQTLATTDTEHALALKRWRENPTCACGCGKVLPNPKKHFIIGHDGKAKAILRKVMRGELPADAVPTELILRHREIRFVMGSPEFRRMVDSWQETS